jgi:type II restriction/modification system DNA methylase subunit YeeA
MRKHADKLFVLIPKLHTAESKSEKATLQNAVDATDREIDQLVYALYELTKDEIALVEAGQRALGSHPNM